MRQKNHVEKTLSALSRPEQRTAAQLGRAAVEAGNQTLVLASILTDATRFLSEDSLANVMRDATFRVPAQNLAIRFLPILLRAARTCDASELRRLADLLEGGLDFTKPVDRLASTLIDMRDGFLHIGSAIDFCSFYNVAQTPHYGTPSQIQNYLKVCHKFSVSRKTIQRRADSLGIDLPQDPKGAPRGKRSKPYHRARN